MGYYFHFISNVKKGPTECCPQGVTKYFYSSERELNQVFWCYTTYLLILFSFWPKINFKSVDFEHFKNGSKWWKWVKMVKLGQNGENETECRKWVGMVKSILLSYCPSTLVLTGNFIDQTTNHFVPISPFWPIFTILIHF